MKTLEDDLFYACLNYCNALNHYKTTEKEMLYRFEWSESEKEKVMRFERDRVASSFERLIKIVHDINEDSNIRW